MKKHLVLMGAAGVALLAAQAMADIQFKYVTDTPSIVTSSSSPIPVKIYLEEDVSGSDASLLTSEGGLFSAGVSVVRNDATAPSQPSSLISLAPATGTNGFNGPADIIKTTAGETDGFWAIGPGGSGVTGTSVDSDTQRVLIGLLNVQPGDASGTTTFTIDGYQDNTLTFNDGFDVDSDSTSPAFTGAVPSTFSVTVEAAAVPEPGTIGLLGVGAATILMRRRRHAAMGD